MDKPDHVGWWCKEHGLTPCRDCAEVEPTYPSSQIRRSWGDLEMKLRMWLNYKNGKLPFAVVGENPEDLARVVIQKIIDECCFRMKEW